MRILDFFRRRRSSEPRPLVVTFTGGMGAQIISAAIYFDRKEQGLPVYADLSYFDKPEKVAVAGDKGVPSHWAWQLHAFGIARDAFDNDVGLDRSKVRYRHAGVEKFELALKALAKGSIGNLFPLSSDLQDVLPGLGAEKYVCVHIRRGDYTNVASHLVSDGDFLAIAKKMSGLLSNVVVLSDSLLDEGLRNAFRALYEKAEFLDNSDAWTAHRIMRGAAALVCSNSQFSLVAALLNPNALVVIPKQWFGGDERAIEVPLHALSPFQTLICQ